MGRSTVTFAITVILIVSVLALLDFRAGAEPTFTEGDLPGSAFAGVVPGPDGQLYGLTYNGGTFDKGTIYSVNPTSLSVTTRHSFNGSGDGEIPYEEMVFDSGTGKFYGTTSEGGPGDRGTVFSFDPTTNAVITLRSDFEGYSYPRGAFVIRSGYIYGTLTYTGGAIYRMALDGSDFAILHVFADAGPSGAFPNQIILGADDKLYGVTAYDGVQCNPTPSIFRCGTIYRLNPVLPKDENVQFQTIFQFQFYRADTCPPGDQNCVTFQAFRANHPNALLFGSDGLIYGSTFYSLFRLDPNNPIPTFQFLWTSGGGNNVSIIEGADNRLYAADYFGATEGVGQVFSINRDGTDFTSLRTFTLLTGSTAYGPYGKLFRDSSGRVFGTTEYTNVAEPFYGTVFALNANTNTPPLLSNVSITSPTMENGVATLAGNITDPDASNTFTVTVDWGDGGPPQVFNYPAGTTSFIETHPYLDDDPTGTVSDIYPINLSLNDSGGGGDTDSTSITVNNAVPALNNIAANPAIITVGGTTSLSGQVTDAGTLDTLQVVINWGDGSTTTTLNLAAGVTNFSSNHQYNSSGTFSVAVTATDDDTGSVNGSASITVDATPQQPPVLSNVAITSPINENSTATLTANISDPNPADTFNLAINWGDGSISQVLNYPAGTTSFSTTHQYTDDNPTATNSDNYTISLSLIDSAGGNDTDSAIVTVNNVAPLLNGIAANPSLLFVGDTTTLSGQVNDVGTLDTHQIVINWGDGSTLTTLNLAAGVSNFNANHQFTTIGTFNIAVTATDDDTGSTTGAASVTVNPIPLQEKIVFTSDRDGNFEIYIMNADGTNQTRLTNNTTDDSEAVLSPDGSRIAFTSVRDGNYEIYAMNSDGSNQTRLTFTSLSAFDGGSSFSSDSKRIAFNSDRDGNGEIYVMNADGSNQTRLTNTPALDLSPYFSPDGNRIAFTSTRDGNGEIYLMNADGSNPTRLTNQPSFDGEATFSPDGTRIAFNSQRGNNPEIFVMNANGTNQTNLTNNGAGDFAPSFSPDGTKVAFQSNRNGNYEIYLMNADGSNPTRLTTIPTTDGGPSFRPVVQEKIVFVSTRDGASNYEIYIMNADGTNQTRLTNNPSTDTSPVLSSDGSRIVFSSDRNGNHEIYVMNANGSNQTRLTNNASGDFSPSFSPDGSRIIFSSFRDGNQEIYVMNANGSQQTRLTNNFVDDSDPSFSPNGNKIVFTSGRDGNLEIYSMDVNGSNQVRLTTNPATDLFPTFSPDGSRIAFTSTRGGNSGIHIMNSDGSNQTMLSNAGDQSPSFNPDGNKIAFLSGRGGVATEIYLMNSDGSNPAPLTNNTAFDFAPSFRTVNRSAAVAGKIAFVSSRDGNEEIYVMSPSGLNQRRLTISPARDYAPAVSRDGTKIAFTSERDGNSEIYLMNSDGSNQTRLTNTLAFEGEPSFSPDGNRLVFVTDAQIYVMSVDGTNLTRLTNNQAIDLQPQFSPDGSRIIFTSNRSGNFDIYVMNTDGSDLIRLTTHPAHESTPTFSPDGNKIAFSWYRGNNLEIFVMNSNGSNQTRLTNTSAYNFWPAFSPESSRIAFVSNRDGAYEIYVMNADGSNPTNLTNNSATDYIPSWGG